MSAAFDRLPLNALRVFEAVATQSSFAEAAETLNVTAAAVSMQIKSLEDYLQTPLFRRGPRNVELTAEGARLLPSVRIALDELRRGVQRLRADRAGGPLQVSMLSSFLQRWFVSRMPAFTSLHPDVDLRIHTSGEMVDFTVSDMHVAIRHGVGGWPPLHNEKLLEDWLLPVGAPDLVRRLGGVDSLQALSRYDLLHSDTEPWSLWTKSGQAEQPPSRETGQPSSRGVALDDSSALLSAAEHGHGLVLARWSLVAAAIDEGRLMRASERCVLHSRSYHFVCPKDYLMLAKVQRLREWLHDEAQRFPRPSGA